MVADPAALNSTDTAVRDRLIALSFIILLADDNSPTLPTEALNREFVYVSDNIVDTANVSAGLCDARAPVMVARSDIYNAMNMTASNGINTNQTDIEIINSVHPMAAGLTGTVTILTSNNNIGWGSPFPSADQIATTGNPSEITIFAYDTDDTITCAMLPAKRVGFPLAASTGASLTAEGWQLFDAAVDWAATP